MIPVAYINEWRERAPWQQSHQVEQDLIISRALVEIFSNSAVSENLAFRGGTALYKLYLNPGRYSEDIDLVQVNPGPIGGLIDALKKQLNHWLGEPQRKLSEGRVTLTYRIQSEEGIPLKLKAEINSREHFTILGFKKVNFKVKSKWFSGNADILTYQLEELLGTKLRGLYQRKKGRDLYDLWSALTTQKVNRDKIIKTFLGYMENEKHKISRAEFEKNFFAKIEDMRFLEDISPLLTPETSYDLQKAADLVIEKLISRLPGDPWKRNKKEQIKKFSPKTPSAD